MDIAKLRLPAYTDHDGQSVILDPEIVPADMNEAADHIERLRAALRRVVVLHDISAFKSPCADKMAETASNALSQQQREKP